MLSGGASASTTAKAVGYESPSQFSPNSSEIRRDPIDVFLRPLCEVRPLMRLLLLVILIDKLSDLRLTRVA